MCRGSEGVGTDERCVGSGRDKSCGSGPDGANHKIKFVEEIEARLHPDSETDTQRVRSLCGMSVASVSEADVVCLPGWRAWREIR